MKLHATQIYHANKTSHVVTRNAILLAFFLLLVIVPFRMKKSNSPLTSAKVNNITGLGCKEFEKCDIFSGRWVPYPEGPYYTNSSCHLIIDQQNCLKFGRPDRDFLKWRWRPDGCELPPFDAVRFLEIVRGKSMAFVGDSLGRNQMQSLLCLLGRVAYPVDISGEYTSYTNTRRYFYTDYNFTLMAFWSPFLVKAEDADPSGHDLDSLMNLDMNAADSSWAAEMESFNYVIISAGHWFFRPMMYYENGRILGCYRCNKTNIADLTNYYGYRMAFRTAFRTLSSLKNYKGMTLMRTYSPGHFENGEWDTGGSCARTKPFSKQEGKMDSSDMEFYLTQMEELRAAEKIGKARGLKFRTLDTTELMMLRPDGHPYSYGQLQHHKNMTVADCVHWCLPGPIDTWNELLQYILIKES